VLSIARKRSTEVAERRAHEREEVEEEAVMNEERDSSSVTLQERVE
jgi:hypothetical protein